MLPKSEKINILKLTFVYDNIFLTSACYGQQNNWILIQEPLKLKFKTQLCIKMFIISLKSPI